MKDLITRLERILHELWLREFVWDSIEVFAPIYDLILEMMAQCGLVFAKHEEEWRIVMYEECEAIEKARQALRAWTNPTEPKGFKNRPQNSADLIAFVPACVERKWQLPEFKYPKGHQSSHDIYVS